MYAMQHNENKRYCMRIGVIAPSRQTVGLRVGVVLLRPLTGRIAKP